VREQGKRRTCDERAKAATPQPVALSKALALGSPKAETDGRLSFFPLGAFYTGFKIRIIS
jgi:hypothetical protein